MYNTLRMKKGKLVVMASVFTGFILGATVLSAAELDPALQAKVAKYEQQLKQWAKDPAIIAAVKQANTTQSSMDNAKWKSLSTSDPEVTGRMDSQAGKKLSQWEQDQSLGKLFLRDKQGNFVAGSRKPAIYNIADRPAFTNAIRGKTWHSGKPKKDPTTQVSSIQVSVPVMDTGKQIGVIHTSVVASKN